MQLRGLRVLGLIAAVLMVFAVVVAIGLRLLPAPHSETDYLVVGSVATFVALGVLFVVLITSYVKSPDIFFKRRDRS